MKLVRVGDDAPGYRRRRCGRGFVYHDPDGARLTDAATLARIRALAIPPAWGEVWICPDPRGHLQATGRDARGRKQYRYHDDWQLARAADKFQHLARFARALPRLRRRIERDLAQRGLPRDKVLAALARLLERTLIRVGNEEYVRANRSYGLTTLRKRHARVGSELVQLRFRGKSGVRHVLSLRDRTLAGVLRRCAALPGTRLFGYRDEHGTVRAVHAADLNDYLREAAGVSVSAKDFRTWGATRDATALCLDSAPCGSAAGSRRCLKTVVEQVAGRLGNTPTVCKASYVHPAVLAHFADALRGRRATPPPPRVPGLDRVERVALALIEGAAGIGR
ncbi:DNA topoisomerase [Chitiniphilus shinanonensis]|uniref:DNA topoisomerase n=1 Tax=Chitiniphilus shinanonensis TaxID=553088 RepID=A0ABQ6BW09_9NEIS|nr:DNA topoisomerase IB [Chitiniphilus shinanonensis]GLS05946.1 DNA topoisomerase [Chitiniphilus shinanonensis]